MGRSLWTEPSIHQCELSLQSDSFPVAGSFMRRADAEKTKGAQQDVPLQEVRTFLMSRKEVTHTADQMTTSGAVTKFKRYGS
jgi:hypothetical protein